MPTSRVNLAGLGVAIIAGLVILHDAQNLLSSLAGLALLVALLSFSKDGARTATQNFAVALVCGLALLCTVDYPLTQLMLALGMSPDFTAKYFPAILWLVGTAIFWFAGQPDTVAAQPVSLGGYSTAPVAPIEVRPAQPTVVRPAPVVAVPQPAPPPPTPVQTPAAPEPVYANVAASSVTSTPMAAPLPAPPPAVAAPVRPALSGKEVNIYVTMLGEGMNVLRSVRAEHLGRDFYIITDEMPADENWEFVPGQVVRCKKKNLSNGKGLVAYEEAPRAQ